MNPPTNPGPNISFAMFLFGMIGIASTIGLIACALLT